MSELWLPRWHCPFLFWPRGDRKRRGGFWTWDCGWLMAINSISHLSSLPHYWVVAGLSWWVLPCCCSAVLLTSEQAVAASSAALRRCSFEYRPDCLDQPDQPGRSGCRPAPSPPKPPNSRKCRSLRCLFSRVRDSSCCSGGALAKSGSSRTGARSSCRCPWKSRGSAGR